MGLLEDFAAWVVYGVLGAAKGDAFAEALDFFVYDAIKVFILLLLAVFLVSLVRTFVTRERIRKLLGGKKEGAGNVLAAILGIPTPFCSCSAVPLFIGFVESGIPLGVTFSFLIASPLINEVALALLFGLFGWKVALLYIGTGLTIAVICGVAIGRLKLEGEVEKFVFARKARRAKEEGMDWKERFSFAGEETRRIVSKVAPFLVLGIGVGALIHGFVPVGYLAEMAGKNNPLAVPLAVLVGIPLYSNAAGTIPIVEALMSKGVALGTALAFMMSVTAISLPEMIMLRRVLKPKLLAVFAAALFAAFTLTGVLFNSIL